MKDKDKDILRQRYEDLGFSVLRVRSFNEGNQYLVSFRGAGPKGLSSVTCNPPKE